MERVNGGKRIAGALLALVMVLTMLPVTVKQVEAENIGNYYAHYRIKDDCIERISLNFAYDFDGDGIPAEGVEFEYLTYKKDGAWQSQYQLYQLPQTLVYEGNTYTYGGGLGDGSSYTKQGQMIEIEWPGFSCQLFDGGMVVVAVSDETGNSFVSVGDILWLEEQPGDKVDTLNEAAPVDPPTPVVDPDAPQIIVESKKARVGNTVDVNIALKNNPGIASLKLKVSYGDDLTLTGIQYNDAIGGSSQLPQTYNSPVTLNWYNGAANSTGDWTLVTLTFAVSESAAGGAVNDITVTYDPDDVYNIAEDNVAFAVVNGAVNVIAYTPGDINGDEKVNNKDLTRLFQYLSDWDVEVVEAALDVNGDGKVNNKDLTRLFQYLSDWDVEIF